MFNKIRSAALALAAVATLGLGALVATTESADAARFGGGFSRGGGGAHVGRHIGVRPHLSIRPSIGVRPIFRPGRPILHRHVHIRRHLILRPSWCGRWPWGGGFRHHCRWPRPVVWPRPIIYPAVAAATYAVAPAVATTRPCTCLTKEYTQDNLVVFKDLCTKEVASAPAGNTQVQLPAGPGAVQQ
jgi:hypothetical protein